jgi:hypothetical protein
VYRKAYSVCFKNVCSNYSFECAPNTVYVFERGLTLLGCSEVNPAVTLLCDVQLCIVLRGCGGKLAFLCNTAMQEHKMGV